MFARLVYESFRRQKRRKLLAGAAITLGVTVATAMIGVATDIGDKINRELRTIGANILVTPQEDTLDVEIGGVNLKPPSDGAFLNETDLPKIKGTFWHNNITGFAPMLPVNVSLQREGKTENLTLLGTYFAKQISYGKEEFTTGVRSTHAWWKVAGAWPSDSSGDVLVGERLAGRIGAKAGEALSISGRELRVSGILSTGAAEDDQMVGPLGLAQEILGKPGAVRRVYVSALTKPEDALARRDPKSMSGPVYDRWYCSPYPQSIAFQLQEAIPHSHAEQIRQVSQNEGAVLTRIEGLIFLVTLAALFASALAVSAAMAAGGRWFDEGSGRGQDGDWVGVFCRGNFAGVDWRSGWLRRRRVAGAADWEIDFQFADHDCARAVPGDSGDCRNCDVCRKRGGDSQGGENGSGICTAG
jgi:putative ABC transport system permease protein